MKISSYSFLLIVLLSLVACKKKKELPTEESGTPVFYFKGDLDGVPVNFEAGNANYYMFSSYTRDTTGVYAFEGRIRKDNCDTTCDYMVTILINDVKATLPAEPMTTVNEALRTGTLVYNGEDLTPLYYKATFTPVKTKDSSHAYKWEVLGGLEPLISHQYAPSFNLNARQTYQVFFNDVSADCDTVHSNYFKADTIFQTTVTAMRQPVAFAYNFSTTTVGGQGLPTYLWNFGDDKGVASTSTLAAPSHTFDGKSHSFYKVRVRVKDANDDTLVSYYQINANPDKDCHANFRAKFLKIPNTRGYTSVTVIISKPGGETYSTKNIIQPKESIFEVLSVNDYDANKNNEPTKRLKIKLNCVLKSVNNKQMVLNNAEAVFAMSYR